MRKTLFACGLLFSCIARSQDWQTLYQQADSLALAGDYDNALPATEKTVAFAKKTYGELDTTYARSIYLLSQLYTGLGDFKKADSLLMECRVAYQRLYGRKSAPMARVLCDHGYVYRQLGKYDKAEPLLLEALETDRVLLGEEHFDYSTDLQTLGMLYRSMGFFERSEPLYLQALQIALKTKGENSSAYASILSLLGVLYRSMGLYDKAETYMLLSETVDKKTMGEDHPEYATTLIGLGQLYSTSGRYDKAEPYYFKALAILKKATGGNHTFYTATLNNLGALYQKMGLYDKAESYFLEALPIDKKMLGDDHPDYAQTLNNLGLFYQATARYAKAEPYFNKAMGIYKEAMGEKHSYYGQTLHNLALLNAQLHRYSTAEKLFAKAIDIQKNSVGENHPEYANVLHSYGLYHLTRGHYKLAEPIFLQTLAIRKKVLDENHPDYAATLSRLAQLYGREGHYAKAEPLMKGYTQAGVANLLQSFVILSEKEKTDFIRNKIRLTDLNNSFLYHYPQAGKELYTDNFNLQVLLKSLVLADTKNVFAAIRASSDSTVRTSFAAWQRNKSLLSRQYALPLSKRRKDLATMEAETETLEKDLSRLSSGFREQQALSSVSAEELQQSLEPDEALVEFVSFRVDNKMSNQPDSILYAAYILRKDNHVPFFVPLFEEKQIQKVIGAGKLSATALAKLVYDKPAAGPGQQLYRLVWEPLEKYLAGIKKIGYSPSGALFNIPLHALPAGSGGSLLIDKYVLQQYGSFRQLALNKKNNAPVIPQSIALFGNPAFTMDSSGIAAQGKKDDAPVAASFYAVTTRSGGKTTWPELRGTANEIKMIGESFGRNAIPATVYKGIDASEDRFKSFDGNSPPVLHIATHGFFLPAPAKKKTVSINESSPYALSEDPLLRSGLVLAGANYAWGGNIPVEGAEDGIVTAYEISHLDLGRTELVVLSACETALGDIKGSEGVFGLQRAFKLAGVKKMIVSLWKIPDVETAKLMGYFYEHWLQGKTIGEAFALAQSDMRKKYSPYYWAGFVLIE